MKAVFNSLSLLLILVIGSNSILSGYSGPEDKQMLSIGQDIISDSKVDGGFNFFVEASSEKIIVPSIKIKNLGDSGLGIPNPISGFLQSGTLRLDWFKKKDRFFDVINLLYPFHFFL